MYKKKLSVITAKSIDPVKRWRKQKFVNVCSIDNIFELLAAPKIAQRRKICSQILPNLI